MKIRDICNALSSKDDSTVEAACIAVVENAQNNLSATDAAAIAVAIADSGERIALPPDLWPLADVPSTGGPASLTTLLCPILLASIGVRVPKISATGSVAGAIDTLALIPGFRAELGVSDFIRALEAAFIAHTAQTRRFCPADRVLVNVRRSRGLMKNKALVAISLLAKKLVVPGTVAQFDFRLGAGGNIGVELDEARDVSRYFLDVAKELNLRVGISITNNRDFPCSALGRLESLHVLHEILVTRQPPLRLDSLHLDSCVELAARASVLANQAPGDARQAARTIGGRISEGVAFACFARHLEAQGASVKGLYSVIDARCEQRVQTIDSTQRGYWKTPDLDYVKTWFKRVQGALCRGDERPELMGNLGLRLVAEPGDVVEPGQPLIEIRSPVALEFTKEERAHLSGWVERERVGVGDQIIEHVE